MTALLADPVTEVLRSAERLLSRRLGSTVTLEDPEDLGGSGKSLVLRVRVGTNPFSLPRTLVVKQVPGDRRLLRVDLAGPNDDDRASFLREAVSYQFATALPRDDRPGAELLAHDLDERILVLSDLGDATPLAALLAARETATNAEMAFAQALGRMHAATMGREEDFGALMRRAGVPDVDDVVAERTRAVLDGCPDLLRAELAVEVGDAVRERVDRTSRRFAGGRFRAFSPFDLCPDNIVVGDDGVQFLDYEWGGFRDATLDIAYALASFPSCLCRIDLTGARARAMAEAWRAEVDGVWPALRDDRLLFDHVLDAQLAWVWASTVTFLPEGDPRIDPLSSHMLAVPRLDALAGRWTMLADFAAEVDRPEVVDHARAVRDALTS